MGKKIVLKFLLPLLIFALAAYSVFWYVKSGEIKKNLTNSLQTNPKSSVGKVTASGFPLSHKIEIHDVVIKFDNQISEEEIMIEKIVAKAKAFSSDFQATIVGDLKVRATGSKIHTIKYTQSPSIYFSVKGYKINKLSYVDDGYKLLDSKGNTIFYAGTSKLDLNVANKGGYDRAKIKANFSNISSFDIFTVGEIIEVAKVEEVVEAEAVIAKDEDLAIDAVAAEELAIPNPLEEMEKKKVEVVKEDKIKTNRNLKIDLEVVSRTRNNKLELKDIIIDNVELFSPLFKINATGFINSISTKSQKTNIILKVRNIDNVLIYVRKFISSLIPADLEIQDAEPVLEEGQENLADEVISESLIIKAIPEEVITGLIIELAGKNPDSNEQVSEFKLQGIGSEMTINDMTILEVWEKLESVREFLIGAFVGNELLEEAQESAADENLDKVDNAKEPIAEGETKEIAPKAKVNVTIPPLPSNNTPKVVTPNIPVVVTPKPASSGVPVDVTP
jgi:hypothetical protein